MSGVLEGDADVRNLFPSHRKINCEELFWGLSILCDSSTLHHRLVVLTPIYRDKATVT
jgi:hypothetical protein